MCGPGSVEQGPNVSGFGWARTSRRHAASVQPQPPPFQVSALSPSVGAVNHPSPVLKLIWSPENPGPSSSVTGPPAYRSASARRSSVRPGSTVYAGAVEGSEKDFPTTTDGGP